MQDLFQDNSTSIYGSRERIRYDLAENIKEYLELKDIDLNKTSFLSYLINTFSGLTANLLFYNSNIYREFFMTKAQMPDSVVNLGEWIDYRPNDAEASRVQILFIIYLDKIESDQINIIIPSDYKVYANDIVYTLESTNKIDINLNLANIYNEIETFKQNDIKVDILKNTSATVTDIYGTYYPIEVNTVNNTVMFMLPFKQEEIIFETFSIPEDLLYYQFFSKKLEFEGNQVSNIEIYIKNNITSDTELPSDYEEWNKDEYEKWERSESGLYTLTHVDKKYIFTSSYGNGEILFGNGIIGRQPKPGSHVVVLLYVTKGEEGIIRPNGITKWEELNYIVTDENGNEITLKVPVSCTNPAKSEGGKNIPTLEEMKSEAIASLRARHRLVSETDYNEINSIITEVPITYSKPILKRSDLKINEITFFNTLLYHDYEGKNELVPTRNVAFQYRINEDNFFAVSDSTGIIETLLYIPSGTKPYNDEWNKDFETFFNMEINLENKTAEYEYVCEKLSSSVKIIDIGELNYFASFNIFSCVFTKIKQIDPKYPAIEMFIQCSYLEDDIEDYQLKMITTWDQKEYLSENYTLEKVYSNGTFVGFVYTFDSILRFPKNEIEIILEVYGKKYNETEYRLVKKYSTTPIIRRDLSDMMFSNVDQFKDSSGSTFVIYDTPVIYTPYLEQDYLMRNKFDTYVLQNIIDKFNVNNKKMLTDFNNIKYCDTYGKLTNMLFNKEDRVIITRSLLVPPNPLDCKNGDLYIVNGGEGLDQFGNDWLNHIHEFAIWDIDHWRFFKPFIGEMVKVNNIYDMDDPDQGRILIFTGKRWIIPVYDIPLTIKLKIVRETSKYTDSALIDIIKNTLYNEFREKFGLDINIDRSEINKVVRSIEGVKYCEVIEPESDIFFNFKINDLTIDELKIYTPQLVMFTPNTISVQIVSYL